MAESSSGVFDSSASSHESPRMTTAASRETKPSSKLNDCVAEQGRYFAADVCGLHRGNVFKPLLGAGPQH